MRAITLQFRCFVYYILCTLSKADIISKRFMVEPSLDNKVSNISIITKRPSESLTECSAQCGEHSGCTCFGFNPQLNTCRIHRLCFPSLMTVVEAGWRHYFPAGPSVGDRCSSTVNCPDNAVCHGGTCVCNGTNIPSVKACHKVTNLALGKNVSASSQYDEIGTRPWQNAVDGRTRFTDPNLLFHTSFDFYPWLTITLGRPSVVKTITIYNRLDINGEWLHNVETRIGISSNWSQMSTCGTYVGPSVTGRIHVIECGKLVYGAFVTVKIVELNYLKVNTHSIEGKNCLVLEEVVVAGIEV